MTSEFEKLRLHFFYCVVMLILFIVLIATDRWTDKPDFTAYLTNAATITSLVLALVAIFYSFISNDGLSKSLGNIATVADTVRQSKDEISKYLQLTTSSSETARRNTEQMAVFSNEVTATLQELDKALGAVAVRTDTLNSAISALPTRLDLLESNVLGAAKSFGEKVTNRSTAEDRNYPIDPEVVDALLANSNLVANLMQYACVLAEQSAKPLSINKFCVAVDEKWNTWLSGFLACMNCADIITTEAIENAPKVYKITMVHPVLAQRAKTYFIKYIKESYAEDENTVDLWMGKLKNVEALFS